MPWGTPWLTFPSAILNPQWDDEPWTRTGIGPVFAQRYPFAGWTRPPLPAVPHVCGEPSQFVSGIAFDPERDVQYTEAGLPLCCVDGLGVVVGGGAVMVPAGGVVIGGADMGPAGGVVVGGGGVEVPTGGVVFGGDDWLVIPPPATSCEDAGSIDLDTLYQRTAFVGSEQWYAVELLATTYHVTRPGGDSSGYPLPTLFTGTCPDGLAGIPPSHVSGSSCWSWVVGSAGTHWLMWFPLADAIDFEFTLSAGAC